MKTIQGTLSAKNKKFAIVASRFNDFIAEKLIEGAVDCLLRHDGDTVNIDLIRVPGAFEIPLAARKAALSKRYDAVICVGAVIRGSTPHFNYIASEVTKGIATVSMETGLPVIFGVLTTDTIEQAIERAGTKAGNKGYDAAMSAMEMIDVLAKL